MEKVFNVNDIMKIKDEKRINDIHNVCTTQLIEKFKNEIGIFVPNITDRYINRITEYTDSNLERIKQNINEIYQEALRICQQRTVKSKKWYMNKMKQYISLDAIHGKHSEVFKEAVTMFNNIVVENKEYKNLSKTYLTVLTNEIEVIHSCHVTSVYIKETFDRPFVDQLKILIVGDRNVGKTSLVSRYTKNHFVKVKKEESFEIIPDVSAKITTVSNKRSKFFRFWNEKTIKLAIWDTCHLKDDEKLPEANYQDKEGVIIVIDVTKGTSILNLGKWVNEINASNPNVKKLLMANKIDDETNREVTTENIEKVAKEHRLLFMEVSAKEGINVEEAFKIFGSILMTDKHLV
jgi:small GTP-binding protein